MLVAGARGNISGISKNIAGEKAVRIIQASALRRAINYEECMLVALCIDAGLRSLIIFHRSLSRRGRTPIVGMIVRR